MANYRSFSDAAESAEATETLTSRVYVTLRDRILSGDLQPGHRMVRRTLSKHLGVSHIPITEALLRLEVDGLVENKPLYGCRVRPLTLEDVQNDQVLREAIECQAARLCAQNASDETLDKLLVQAKKLDRIHRRAEPNSRLALETHMAFHAQVARATGYPVLAAELERVWFRRLMRLAWIIQTRYNAVPDDWHEQLVKVILTRDPDKAERKMREHVRYGNEFDRKAIQDYLAQTASEDA